MSKIEINNEIVLMRHIVRKARLHIIRKLVRQVKIFGNKKGDEKHREKCKRKADKLGEELAVIKKLKEDGISRYSIKNERTLEEVLADVKSDAELRVLARLASHKIILDRVAKFKEKFPNYEEHLGPGKRRLKKLKRKAGKMAKKEAKSAQLFAKEEDKEQGIEEDEEQGIEGDESNDDSIRTDENIVENLPPREESNELSESVEKEGEEIEHNKRKAETDSSGFETKKIKTTSIGLPELKKGEKIQKSIKSRENKSRGITATSKEATVKSFARFLEEKDENGSAGGESADIDKEVVNNEDDNKIELEKEVDSFFMTEDGGGEYLSVVVPKSELTEEDNIDERAEPRGINAGNFSKSRNNRFFDKVDNRFDKTKRNYDGRDKSGFVRGDRFKNRSESRGFINNNNINNNNKKNNDNGTKARRDFSSGDKSLNENMHPSWAAKKKQQEILKLGFQGKKIVFDNV